MKNRKPEPITDELSPQSSASAVIAYVIERLICKRGAPDWYEAKTLGEALRWALAEVKDTPEKLPLLECLRVDVKNDRTVMRNMRDALKKEPRK
jgi:hypothetical protein